MARPTKWNEKYFPYIKKIIQLGGNDKDIAEICNVTEQTVNNWKSQNPQFFESLKDWKEQADKEVEKSLYKRAMGYSHKEDKIFNDQGKPLVVPTIKHYPPDSTSMIFWLKNRQPAKWRDKQEHSVSFTEYKIGKSDDIDPTDTYGD